MNYKPADVVRRPPGRPRVAEPSTSVSAWVPNGTYDRLVRLANEREQSVSALVRDLLILRIPR